MQGQSVATRNKFSAGAIKKEIIQNEELVEELHKPVVEI